MKLEKMCVKHPRALQDTVTSTPARLHLTSALLGLAETPVPSDIGVGLEV